MKKHWKIYSLITLIFLAGLFIRLYRLPELMNFSQEQAWALGLTADMVNDRKPALIATPYLSRETISKHYFFQAGTYLYPILPLYLLFRGEPLPITAVFALINILTGLALFFVTKKFFSQVTAVFAFFLYAFYFVLVDYSRLIWHVPLLLPFVVALIYFFLKDLKKFRPINSFWIGLLLGTGWGIHVSLTVLGALYLLFSVVQSYRRRNLWLTPLYVVGGLLGILPLIIFDLRHELFNSRILWEFFIGLFTHTNKDAFFLTPYHLVHLIPVACILLGWFLSKLFSFSKPFAILMLVFYLFFNAPHWRLTAPSPLGLPEGWNLSGVKQVSAIIAAEADGKFAVAQIIEGETRASNLRYFLDYKYQKHPLPDTDYPYADSLYVLARDDQDVVNYSVWEINSIKPVVVVKSWTIQNNYVLYKLIKKT